MIHLEDDVRESKEIAAWIMQRIGQYLFDRVEREVYKYIDEYRSSQRAQYVNCIDADFSQYRVQGEKNEKNKSAHQVSLRGSVR